MVSQHLTSMYNVCMYIVYIHIFCIHLYGYLYAYALCDSRYIKCCRNMHEGYTAALEEYGDPAQAMQHLLLGMYVSLQV